MSRLLHELAFPAGPAHGTVALNYRRSPASDFGAYAAAFQRAGYSLATQLASAHGYRDTDACPIVYLYRQALELYVKGVIVSGRRLLDLAGKPLPVTETQLNAHRLTPLVPGIAAVFRVAGWRWNAGESHFRSQAAFRSYLASLESVDPMSFSFRYPVDKRGGPSLTSHFRFNVLAFVEELTPVLSFLDGALTGLDELWQERAEAAYEAQRT
jgi:hypothetical protein